MPDDTGSQSDSGTDNQQQQPPPAQQQQGAQGGGQQQDDLGEAGKRAIEAERAARKVAQKELDNLRKELDALKQGSMSEQEKAVEQARREARAEASKAFNARLLQAEVRAAAAGKLADPEDAIRFLDLDDIDVDDDGTVDKKAITKKLDELVKAKPYLAASATRPTGSADQGARGTSGGSSMNDLIRSAAGRGGAR